MPFSPDRWHAISPHLDHAMDLAPGERGPWLDRLRVTDPALAADLESLLQQHEALEREGFLEDHLPHISETPSLAGRAVGAYTLTSLIGQGGMGTVWLAERSDGRFVGKAAVKLLNVALVGGSGAERFTREGSILARLNHPGVARLIDAGMSTFGQPYLVLEYVEGEHIDQYCDRNQLGIHDRIRLFLEVLDAVGDAHANLVVHRDIKPSNVLVTASGRVKLLDFGIAKLIDPADTMDAAPLTVDSARLLTPGYAAPEQITGEPITTATDVYALGVLLYVLLGGRHPAGSAIGTPAEVVERVLKTDPQRMSAVAESPAARRLLRGDLDNIAGKALKKRPAERYPSVGAFAADLRRYLAHETVSARPDTWRYRTGKFVKRHGLGLAASAAILVLIAGLVGFYTARLARERDRARLEADKSAQVSELLAGLLTGADPYARSGPEPTVRDVLNAGAARVENELAGQPELQAEMLAVIGRVFQRMGQFETAQPLLQRSLDIGRATGGPDHPRVAQTLNDLGVLLHQRGNDAAAKPMLEESLALRRRLLGSRNREVAVTLVELGRVYESDGNVAGAEALFREALEIRRSVLGAEHRETATSMDDLALLLWRKGDVAAAEPLFRGGLAVNRKALGDNHPNVASSMNNLALIAMEKRDFETAQSMFRGALDIRRRTLGPDHPQMAATLSNLAHALRELGRYDEAEPPAQDAVRIGRASLGDQHPQLAVFMTSLARVHLARRHPELAEPLARETLRLRLQAYGEQDWRVAASKSLLGAALTDLRRFAEAEPLLVEATRMLKDVPGAQGRESRTANDRLAALRQALAGRVSVTARE